MIRKYLAERLKGKHQGISKDDDLSDGVPIRGVYRNNHSKIKGYQVFGVKIHPY
jgi:hypothetical protein